jgi:uncharacterized RDD family membrane protein YckC
MPTDNNPFQPPTDEAPLPRANGRRISPSDEASKQQRFATYVVDRIVTAGLSFFFSAAGVPAFFVVSVRELDTIPRVVVSWLWAATLIVAYYVICEGTSQRTLGKLVVGTRVVDVNHGGAPSLKQIVGRTFARLIPFEPFSFFGEKPGWHDDLSDTRVVLVRPPRR